MTMERLEEDIPYIKTTSLILTKWMKSSGSSLNRTLER